MGKKFKQACIAAGFDYVKDPRNADIIVAHSGGCFLLPDDLEGKLIFQIGLPYWPGKPWLVATWQKVRLELQVYRGRKQLRSWVIKWLQHIRYAFNVPAFWRMVRNRDTDKPWNNAYRQVIVRNRDDAYSSPSLLDIIFRGPRVFISLPGGHDDIWQNPKPYVDLLQLLQ